MRTILAMTLALGMTLAAAARGQTATQPGAETLPQLEARLVALRKEAGEVEKKIAAARGGEKAVELASILKTMPATLAPKKGETARQAGERQEWLEKALVGRRVVVALRLGTANTRTPAQHRGTMVGSTDIVILFDGGDDKAYKGDTLSVEGEVSAIAGFAGVGGVSGNTVTLKDAKVLTVKP